MSPPNERTRDGDPRLSNKSANQTDNRESNNPAPADLEDWASFTAGLHFRHDLVGIVHLRRKARDRAAQRRRRQAREAVERTRPPVMTADEIRVQRETAVLYHKVTRLTAAGKIRWDDYKSDWVVRPVFTRTDSTRPPVYTSDEILSRFDKVRRQGKGWTGRCPAHTDKRPSLAISQGNHAWLLRCWAGCTYTEILHAADLNPQRMFNG